MFHPRLILPALLFCGVLALGLRLGDMWQVAASGKMPSLISARAQTKSDAAPSPSAAPSPPVVDTSKPADAAPAPSASASPDDESSPAEMEVLKQLSNRRDQLDKRAHELDTRESLIKVGEQRVDQKIKEMQLIRVQLQQMVDQISGAQQTQLDNLVKIYETMKPADAAKIFENLDMKTLLGVIQHMKPKSTAPILAAMAPQKAKEVTVALTKQDQLPGEEKK